MKNEKILKEIVNKIISVSGAEKIILFGFSFLLLVIIFSGCKPSKVDPAQVDLGYNYFPLAIGDSIIYDVLTIDYSSLGGFIDTQNYQLLEVTADTFIDNESDIAWRLERFSRPDSSANWPLDPDSVWTTKVTSYQAIKVESNIPYIKLIFPVENGVIWDGNALNTIETKEGEEYRIRDLGLADTIGNNIFNNTLKVIQPFITSQIGKYERSEVYARNQGLIYKESILVDYCDDPGCIFLDSIVFGKKYFQIYNYSNKE
ncbi:MAG: hypothetical protein FVQ77_16465 [Cytophagales bacterium]|nr:hypothetical protein [Cytophagales bacterium]